MILIKRFSFCYAIDQVSSVRTIYLWLRNSHKWLHKISTRWCAHLQRWRCREDHIMKMHPSSLIFRGWCSGLRPAIKRAPLRRHSGIFASSFARTCIDISSTSAPRAEVASNSLKLGENFTHKLREICLSRYRSEANAQLMIRLYKFFGNLRVLQHFRRAKITSWVGWLGKITGHLPDSSTLMKYL